MSEPPLIDRWWPWENELRNMSPYQSVLMSESEAMYASCAALSPLIPANSPTPALICPTMPTIGYITVLSVNDF